MAENTPHIAPSLKPSGSLAPEYFDRLYAERADPWDFASSHYETEKYAATLAALPRQKYARALELGCSIGVLTNQLAPRCEHLLAIDVSERPLAQARLRCVAQPHVVFAQCDISTAFPTGQFDLILLSEIGYYFSLPDLEKLRGQLAAALLPHGHLLLVHYTGETNYPLRADTVHETFLAWENTRWLRLFGSREQNYMLDLFEAMA
jgi:SAM-dependent methyltransferase